MWVFWMGVIVMMVMPVSIMMVMVVALFLHHQAALTGAERVTELTFIDI